MTTQQITEPLFGSRFLGFEQEAVQADYSPRHLRLVEPVADAERDPAPQSVGSRIAAGPAPARGAVVEPSGARYAAEPAAERTHVAHAPTRSYGLPTPARAHVDALPGRYAESVPARLLVEPSVPAPIEAVPALAVVADPEPAPVAEPALVVAPEPVLPEPVVEPALPEPVVEPVLPEPVVEVVVPEPVVEVVGEPSSALDEEWFRPVATQPVVEQPPAEPASEPVEPPAEPVVEQPVVAQPAPAAAPMAWNAQPVAFPNPAEYARRFDLEGPSFAAPTAPPAAPAARPSLFRRRVDVSRLTVPSQR